MAGAEPGPGGDQGPSAGELAASLDRILAAAERRIRPLPETVMDRGAPGGGTVRDSAHRLFRLALAFADAMDTGQFPAGWLREGAPVDLRDGAAVARYGALVRGRLGGWFEGAGPGEYGRVIETLDGPGTGRGLLERTVARAARDLEQLNTALAALGLPPEEPSPAPGACQ